MYRLLLAVALLVAALAAGVAARTPQGAAAICLNDAGALPVAAVQLLPIGTYRGPRASADARAQRLFEQGLVYGWGFNFAEAVRSFRAATLADLDCALCRWGIAWALGPSINHDMRAADVPVALDAIAQARAYAGASAGPERALIDALALRYSDAPDADREQLAQAYAEAMRAVAARYADDADVAVLAAEAVMNAHPYDYWRSDGRPQPWTADIVALLDRANRIAPGHPAAHHYRIHLYEDSRTPQRALASAEQIAALAPGSGHLVHMPSHIYLRVGRYHDAVLANRAAVEADRAYFATVKANPEYAADYVPHNLHFLWASALWSGESAVALQAAEELVLAAGRLPEEEGRRGTRQHLQATPWLTLVRFAQWNAVLARPRPTVDAPYLRGLIDFAQGVAHARNGDLAEARRAAATLEAAEVRVREQQLRVKNINPAAAVLAVARALLAAELALAGADALAAVRHARAAVLLEDALESDEPPAWQLPARHTLGRALLVAGRAQEAGVVFRADLARHPDNAVALQGLAQAQRRLGHAAAATELDRRARQAWSHADTALPPTTALQRLR